LKLNAEQIVKALGGKLLSGNRNTSFASVSTDTRTLREGELFFALSGPNFDGHKFLAAAKNKGASGAVVSQRPSGIGQLSEWPVIEVEDVPQALGQLASYHRHSISCRIVAITGSAGKTTTKELIAHLLSEKLPGVKAPKSFNNDIGVPLTLLQIAEQDQFAVVEIGANDFGEIESLSKIVKPNIGLITCIGDAHLERFGSRWGVAWEKGHLIAGLPSEGIAILNADDQWCRHIAKLAGCKVIMYGESSDADVRIDYLDASEKGLSFIIDSERFCLNVPGRHNALNAAGAVAVAREFGLTLTEISERMNSFRLPPMRMEMYRCGSVTVIADQYNASPTSVSAAIEEYGRMKCCGRKVLVLGDMLELGAASGQLHSAVGERAAQESLTQFWTVGALALDAGKGAVRAGMDPQSVRGCLSTEEACRLIPEWVEPNDTLLLKGSRGMKLEALLSAIEDVYGPVAGGKEAERRQEKYESYRVSEYEQHLSEGA